MTEGWQSYRTEKLPEATVLRLGLYQRVLAEFARARRTTISSDELGRHTGENPANVRKDLSRLGTLGTRGTGYDVGTIAARIDEVFATSTPRRVVVVGLGNLGRALVRSRSFFQQGFEVAALFDSSPAVVGTTVAGHVVQPMESVTPEVEALGARFGVLTVPPEAAQDAVERLVRGGVGYIVNFAPKLLQVEPTVVVRYVDLSIELQMLGYVEAQGLRSTTSSSIGSSGRQLGSPSAEVLS